MNVEQSCTVSGGWNPNLSQKLHIGDLWMLKVWKKNLYHHQLSKILSLHPSLFVPRSVTTLFPVVFCIILVFCVPQLAVLWDFFFCSEFEGVGAHQGNSLHLQAEFFFSAGRFGTCQRSSNCWFCWQTLPVGTSLCVSRAWHLLCCSLAFQQGFWLARESPALPALGSLQVLMDEGTAVIHKGLEL